MESQPAQAQGQRTIQASEGDTVPDQLYIREPSLCLCEILIEQGTELRSEKIELFLLSRGCCCHQDLVQISTSL
jgi:hypothetical protein